MKIKLDKLNTLNYSLIKKLLILNNKNNYFYFSK